MELRLFDRPKKKKKREREREREQQMYCTGMVTKFQVKSATTSLGNPSKYSQLSL